MKRHDPLVDKMKSWETRHLPEESHFNDLRESIVARAKLMGRPATSDNSAFDGGVPHLWLKLGYAGIGVVLSLAAILYVGRMTANGEPLQMASLSREDVRDNRLLFGEVKQLFEHKLRWVSESNGDVKLGIESNGKSIPADTAPVVVRLTVVCRESGEQQWKHVWQSDVVVHGQDQVEVIADAENDNKVVLWVYPLSDGKIMVDTSMDLNGPVPLIANVSAIVTEGEPSQIMSMNIGGAEYRAYQTLRLVDESV